VIPLLVGLAHADAPPARSAETTAAFGLLDEQQPRAAEAAFRAILAADPRALDAREGLVRALLANGDPEGAALVCDEGLRLDPHDTAWQRRRMFVLGLAPSRRAEAIEAYEALLSLRKDDAEAQTDLAQFLSWTPGRLADAVRAYRRAVRLAPEDRRARLGLARTLSWSGANREAGRTFDELLAEDPRDLDALLGSAALARWTGDTARAGRLLARAERVAPQDGRVAAERAWQERAAGRRTRAWGSVREALERSPRLYEAGEVQAALRRDARPEVGAAVTVSREARPFQRLDVQAPTRFHLLPDTEAEVVGGWTRFDDTASLDRVSVGAGARQEGLPAGLYARIGGGAQQLLGAGTTWAGTAEVGTVRPAGLPLEARLGARHRPLIDDPVAEGSLGSVGSGGSTVAGIRQGLEVDEAFGGGVASPSRGLYVYVDAAVGRVEDDNGRRSVAAGIGQDVLRLVTDDATFGLTAKYDLYYLAYDRTEPTYFSPTAYFVHAPGLGARWSPDRFTLTVEGGVPIEVGGQTGWAAAASARWTITERWAVAARGRAFDDTAYQVWAAGLEVTGGW
jgi:tetratricopeptide (TPR) repeat protein